MKEKIEVFEIIFNEKKHKKVMYQVPVNEFTRSNKYVLGTFAKKFINKRTMPCEIILIKDKTREKLLKLDFGKEILFIREDYFEEYKKLREIELYKKKENPSYKLRYWMFEEMGEDIDKYVSGWRGVAGKEENER